MCSVPHHHPTSMLGNITKVSPPAIVPPRKANMLDDSIVPSTVHIEDIYGILLVDAVGKCTCGG